MSESLGFISGSEIIIVFLVVLLLFGADKIPEIARGLGKGMKEFRKVTGEIKREFDDSTSGIKKDINEFKKGIDHSTEEFKSGARDYLDDTGFVDDLNEVKDDLSEDLKDLKG